MYTHIIIWIISVLSIAGVIIRPFHIAEAIWAVSGAVLLVVLQLILPAEAITGMARGTADVYLFLTGMMLLAEVAKGGTTPSIWLAAQATNHAKGSPERLFPADLPGGDRSDEPSCRTMPPPSC